MAYTPHTPTDIQNMLDEIGLDSVEDLITSIPDEIRLDRPLDLPTSKSEQQLFKHVNQIDQHNQDCTEYTSFLGGGMYFHYTPAAVSEISSRSEFYTAYTPYQAEASQGVLQAFYEYQSMMCALTGMEISNASLYDGPSSLAEALLMISDESSEERIYLPETLHPEYRKVTETYLQYHPASIHTIPRNNGTVSLEALDEVLRKEPGHVVIQHPNFFGNLEPVHALGHRLEEAGRSLVSVNEPISLALLDPPGNWNAEVSVGDLQPLGIPLSFGGPSAGFLTTDNDHLRQMPGRLIGKTKEKFGKEEEKEDAYVMTLQTREQHIRREKATSNICTNQGLLALHASVYLAAVGQKGLQEIANLCVQKAHYLKKRILELPGFTDPFPDQSFVHEFVVSAPEPVEQINNDLLNHDVIGGLDLSDHLANVEHPWMLCATEWNSRDDIDHLISCLQEHE